MSRPLQLGLFIIIATLVTSSVHYYLYRRLVRAPTLPDPWRRISTITIIFFAICTPLAAILHLIAPLQVSRIVSFPVFVWIGTAALLFFTFLGVDAVRLGARLVRLLAKRAPPNEERRRFMARVVAGVATGGVFTAVPIGVRQALGKLVVSPVTVPLARLPKEMDGFTIAQITDLHLGPMRSSAFLEEVVERVNSLNADLVAITGDLVDGSVAELGPEVASLERLRAKHGVYFVTGNHEYYSGAVEWEKELTRLGIRVLNNERVSIGGEEASFDLAGVNDYRSKGLAPGHAHDVAAAVRGRDESRELVLLAHQPLSIFDAAKHKTGLVLAGHTHGGQFWPVIHISPLVNRYVSGLHDHEGTWIYVSSGTGFWGPPLRLLTTAEIALVSLRST